MAEEEAAAAGNPSPVVVVVAMKGHPGTGKSTLARAVATALRCPLLDKDDVRDSTLPLQQALASSSPSAPSLLNDLSYSVLWRMTETQLRLGLSVVVDSPLSRRSHLNRLLEAARSARVVVVECRAGDEGEWRRRLEARGGAAGGAGWHKPATWGELQGLVEGYGGCSDYDVGGVPRLVVDTTAAPAATGELVSAVMDFISANGGGAPPESAPPPPPPAAAAASKTQGTASILP